MSETVDRGTAASSAAGHGTRPRKVTVVEIGGNDVVWDACSLTERERAVVSEITRGAPLKMIASRLSISVQAVSTYLLRAKRKLGAKSRDDLLASCTESPLSLDRIKGTLSRLTPAEVAVGNALVSGESYSSIARTRATSARTVQHQVSKILRKCGVASRYELAALARGTVSGLTRQPS